MDNITLTPIGFVENRVDQPRFGSFADEISVIVLDEELTDGLTGIEEYSHAVIVFWMDRVSNRVITHRPQGNPDVPVIGIFSCRCPQRPNPIAVTTVEIVDREQNRLRVKGLDILNGTPVIDVKPYWPVYDEVEKAEVPSWVGLLDL